MPQVSLRGGQRVDLAPIPGERATAALTPDAAGAGLAEAQAGQGATIAGLGGAVEHAALGLGELQTKIREDGQRQADEIALLNASNKLDAWENERLYNPETGALAQKGEQARGLPEQIATEYQDLSGAIASHLTTPRQQMAFAKLSAQHEQNLDLTIRRHVFSEIQSSHASELTAFLDNKKNNAVTYINDVDPRRTFEEITAGVQAITRNAPQMGLGPEEVTKQIDAFRTASHIGAIDALLAQGKSRGAQVYFEETKDQISGAAAARIEKAIAEGKLRGESQDAVDQILTAGGTPAEQRAKVDAIKDPELRDAADTRLEHALAIKEKADRDQAEGTLTAAYNTVDRARNVDAIPPAVWNSLPGPQRSALREYTDRLVRGVPTETDPVAYYGAIGRAGDDPTGFSKENLLVLKAKLSEADFKQLADLQLSIRNGDRKKADEQTAPFRTNDEVIKSSLAQYGVDTSAKQTPQNRQAVGELYSLVDRGVTALLAAGKPGQKATNADVQSVVDKILEPGPNVPGSFWSKFTNLRLERSQVPGKSIFNTTIADVPPADQAAIRAALGPGPVSDVAVLDWYLRRQMAK